MIDFLKFINIITTYTIKNVEKKSSKAMFIIREFPFGERKH